MHIFLITYMYLFKLQSQKHIGVAIGEWILDLNVISHLFTGPLLKDKQHVFKVCLILLVMLIIFSIAT